MVLCCNELNIPIPTGKRKPKEPMVSLQEKKEIASFAKELSLNTLAHLCIIVEQECPEAYVKIDTNKYMIAFDKVGYSTFQKLKE